MTPTEIDYFSEAVIPSHVKPYAIAAV